MSCDNVREERNQFPRNTHSHMHSAHINLLCRRSANKSTNISTTANRLKPPRRSLCSAMKSNDREMRKSEFNAARRLFCVLRAILFVHSVLFSLVQRFPSLRLPRMADGGCQMPTMVEGPFFVLRLPKIYLQKCISFSRSFLVARLTLRTRQSHQLNALHVRHTHTHFFSSLQFFSALALRSPIFSVNIAHRHK